MSKFCTNPNCSEYGKPVDDGFLSCPYCGSNLANNLPIGFNLGDANAISGGININQSKNVTSHDTHYHSTVIREHAKSEEERRLDAANDLRAKAQAIMSERGRLDSTAMAELKPLSLKLGVDDNTFKSIIKEVRSNRVGASNGLNAANGRYLLQAQQAVQTNDMDSLSNLTPRLEAMAAISQDDSVQYLYYMTLCILYPIKSMEVYEKQTDENYWRTFWAIVSYIRTCKYAEATKMLTQFDPVRFDKLDEDLNLLEAYFNIMKGEKDAAQEFLDEILDEPSSSIQMLLKAIEAKLYEEEPQSLEVKFYSERVLQKADVVVKSKNSEDVAPAVNKDPENSNLGKNIEAEKIYQEACSSTGLKRVMLLQKAADAGSAEAMFDLSNCYMEGEEINENIPLAIKWMQKSADAGYTRAQTTLGGCYVNGFDGFDPNLALAEKYLLLAAEKEDIEAQSLLANFYLNTEDYGKSIIWARKGAQHENAVACFVLGRIYEEGLGVDVNHLEALKWFEKSADNGDAQNIVGNMYRTGGFVDNDYQKAFKYYHKAAVQGNADAMWNLACAYHKGEGVAQDESLSQKWLKDAAELGYKDAIEILSRSNEQEQHTDLQLEEIDDDSMNNILQEAEEAVSRKDYALAYKKFKEAEDMGCTEASDRVEEICDEGDNFFKINKYKDALTIVKPFAEAGHIESMYILGYILTDDTVLLDSQENELHNEYIDFQKGFQWLMKAAVAGNYWAMIAVGFRCYECGKGVEISKATALDWYQKALDKGGDDKGRENTEWLTWRIDLLQTKVSVGEIRIGNDGDHYHYFKLEKLSLHNISYEKCRIKLEVDKLPKWQRFEVNRFEINSDEDCDDECVDVYIIYLPNKDNISLEANATAIFNYVLTIENKEDNSVLFQTKGTYCVKRVHHMFRQDGYVIL